MFCVYILENKEGRHYIGYTSKDPNVRLKEHNESKTKWTKFKGPWSIVYCEEYETKEDAYRRERKTKSYKGGRAFKKLLEKVN